MRGAASARPALRASSERRALRGAALALALVAGCRSLPPLPPDEPEPAPHARAAPEPTGRRAARGAIVACGRRFAVDAPVVLWDEAPFYDARSLAPRFGGGPRGKPRCRPTREAPDPALAARVAREGWTLAALRDAVDLFVLHYDACGTSRRCFEVLQDERCLSVHFLLDVDGTIYQTLDLACQAWHAGGAANPRSVGVEIAHVGAFAPGEAEARSMAAYLRDAQGLRLRLAPEDGVRTPGFVGRPARPGLVRGRVQGQELAQLDFTPEQYASLASLAAALVELFPRLALEVPREGGRPGAAVRSTALEADELARFHGILGHWHVGAHKVDPGPAFDWERFLDGVRARLTQP